MQRPTRTGDIEEKFDGGGALKTCYRFTSDAGRAQTSIYYFGHYT